MIDQPNQIFLNLWNKSFRGFGAFTVREYKAYEGRNPKTGEKITVPPKKLPFWKTGQELKQRVDSAF